MADLLERDRELAALADGLREAQRGRGRLTLVVGEAGAGKTTLVRSFCAGAGSTRALWGACDALATPRPLGPLADIAAQTGGELEEAVDRGDSAHAVLAALRGEVDAARPAIVVLEDVHWADEATLDVLRVLGRRATELPALVIATFRDDELTPDHPLRQVLGELARAEQVGRVALAPLSPDAVRALARPHGVDGGLLHARTSGNPFFVTEVLAGGETDIPPSVRDAVLARVARLTPAARHALDAVAIVPPRIEPALLEAIGGPDALGAVDDALGAGVLVATGAAVGFRHELARIAVEDAIPPGRKVSLHRRALAALAETPGADPARLAHHAQAAGDDAATLLHAAAAGERAAALGAHREAADQFARALRAAGPDADGARRAELLERRSYECYLTDQMQPALAARREAMECRRALGDTLAEGDDLRWISRLLWFNGLGAEAEGVADRAIAMLEPLPAGRQLAMAYSNKSQLRMLASDMHEAVRWGEQAIELAERLGEIETVIHALNNVGAARQLTGDPEGLACLRESLERSLAAGLEEHAARAYTNLGAGLVRRRVYADADEALAEGLAYCLERDLDAWHRYMLGWRARSDLDQGRWAEAAEAATEVLDLPHAPVPTRLTPLCVLGLLRARRGDPGAWDVLDEARDLALGTGESQRICPVASARAETLWLEGRDERIDEETARALEIVRDGADAWEAGALVVWRWRAGLTDDLPPDLPAPARATIAGDHEAAARGWEERGCRYDAALARADSSDEHALRRAHDALVELDAAPAAALVARRLRELGARGLPRGPRRSTRASPAGLTPRQTEILALVAAGMRNAEIAARLHVTSKTVEHHVSAILQKLGARTRAEAGVQAVSLGLVEPKMGGPPDVGASGDP